MVPEMVSRSNASDVGLEETILWTRDLILSFGALKAVDRVSISVPRRKITLIIGPNGSGKTSLINAITGVYRPQSGSVIYEGREITGLPPHKINDLGIVRTFQIPQPFLRLTVLENLLISDRTIPRTSILDNIRRRRWSPKEVEIAERVFKILRFLNLDGVWDYYAYQLSGGQLKLLELGRALVNGARLIIMDEPIAGILPTLAYTILEHMRKAVSELGVTILAIEHRLDIALKYVDHVYAMHRGRVIAQGSPEEVISNPQVIESYLGG
ncbi:MAG: ABC transporter ATP-binding protein [Desulfurococcales archaeon]|jgi:branched-chain amino acid transport system ATP-binding protein|nr:ABC transporter ATP-binding protein [Desulfurococcales archaeon]